MCRDSEHRVASAPLCWHTSVGLSHAASPHPGHPKAPVWHLLPVSLGERPQQGVLMWRNSRRVACMHSMERLGAHGCSRGHGQAHGTGT